MLHLSGKDKHIESMIKGMMLWMLLAFGCSTDSYRQYYFPLKRLTDGIVYVYTPDSHENLGDVYWYYRSIIDKEGKRMTASYYEGDPAPLQISREIMTDEGMVQESLMLYDPAENGKLIIKEAEIKRGLVFPFDAGQRKESVHRVKWKEGDGEIEVVKKRIVVGKLRYAWEGKQIESIELAIEQQVLHHADGTLELNSKGREIYAKGLGLVYYEIVPEEGVSWAYRLKERISMEELGRRLLSE
jgi:hypothetical protein